MSATLEHHGHGGGGKKAQVPPVAMIGGGAVLLVLLLALARPKGGGVTVIPGAAGNTAAYQAQLGAYESQTAAAAQQRSEALRASLSLTEMRNGFLLAKDDLDMRRQLGVRQLELQDKAVTYQGENDRLSIQSNERVGLADISMRRAVGLADVEGRTSVGMAQVKASENIGMAQVGVMQSDVDNRFKLGTLSVNLDDKFRYKQMDTMAGLTRRQMDYGFKLGNKQLDNDFSLGSQRNQNEYSLGQQQNENDRYRAGTERQGTWINGIGGFLGPILKLFGF